MAVLREDGTPAAAGEIGEITCRSDVVMTGYWNDLDATRETLRNGWLRTGDMGYFDARGYLALRDRSKDVVISGGSNVYPREVEEALLEHPGVSEACVAVRRTPNGERSWLYADRLPKNGYGKVLRRELRQQLLFHSPG